MHRQNIPKSTKLIIIIIISVWMSSCLLHDSMVDSVIMAREKHLVEGGLMLPSHAKILAAPVQLDAWNQEQYSTQVLAR